jgi:hypothetical protein
MLLRTPAFETLESRRLLAGDLDLTFGMGGLAISNLSGRYDASSDFAFKSNGAILFVSGALNGFMTTISRFNALSPMERWTEVLESKVKL